MCIVHRICGNTIFSYVERDYASPVRPYHQEIDTRKPVGRRESIFEKRRREEINRLSGANHRSEGLELHQLSPQSSPIIEPVRFDNWYEGSGARKYSPHGRNDCYKTNRHNRVAIW